VLEIIVSFRVLMEWI